MPVGEAACAALLAAGADLFEVDVQLSRSGLVVSHYGVVPHTGGWLQRDGWRLRGGRGEGRDPRLSAHLRAVPDDTRILLDPKDKVPERRDALITEIINSFPDRSRFVVSTGSATSLRRLRDAGFETWQSVGDRAGLDRLLAGGRVAADGVTVRHTLLDAAVVERLHGLVERVVAWTVNRVERAEKLRGWGVNGITTDRVGVLAAMAAR